MGQRPRFILEFSFTGLSHKGGGSAGLVLPVRRENTLHLVVPAHKKLTTYSRKSR
jgi:hypothetical protein